MFKEWRVYSEGLDEFTQNWFLGGHLNTASEEAFGRRLGMNTVEDPHSDVCGRCDKNYTCYV